ncbi:MAG: hypothetical protein MI824_19570 [Hyphomicrobiales bacterium]|nr:hypothetical protein [Hyphomicrobiales bacterium]
MCAVGHFLEDEGLATVGITLVRPHVEAIEPPRALWVPFELGRPLGVPDDPAFQHRVLRAALDLLVCDDGPVLLADYPEDAPAVEVDMEGWACPVALKPPPDESTGYEAAIAEEIASLRTWHDQAVKERGRSTVGVTDTDIVDVGRFLASQLGDAPRRARATARTWASATPSSSPATRSRPSTTRPPPRSRARAPPPPSMTGSGARPPPARYSWS